MDMAKCRQIVKLVPVKLPVNTSRFYTAFLSFLFSELLIFRMSCSLGSCQDAWWAAAVKPSAFVMIACNLLF